MTSIIFHPSPDLAAPSANPAQRALWAAVREMDPIAARAALTLGADPDAMETIRPDGKTVFFSTAPLFQCAISPRPQSVELVRALLDFNAAFEFGEHPNKNQALPSCASESSALPDEKIALFLERGASPNAVDPLRSETAAHRLCAATRHQARAAAAIEHLALAGADFSLLNQRGYTAFDCAIEHGNLPAIQALWAAGARPNWKLWEAKRQEPDWQGSIRAQKRTGLQAALALLEQELLSGHSAAAPRQRKPSL